MWDPEGGGDGEEGNDGPKEEPHSSFQEELKDQFQQQRDKIEELKAILMKNEENMMSREKEVEKYATKLTDIKHRSRASKRKLNTPVQASPEVGTPEQEAETSKKEETSTPRRSSAIKQHGNLVLLRKQLEENRAKFELRGKEMNENRKGIEEKVQHLKNQLDERDVKIKELQKHLDTQLPMDISHEGNASGEGEIIQDVRKENKIIELNRKIADLETQLLDLQESIIEKDSVVAARTKAIALMSEDFSRRSKTTVDNLEETREEMRKMQNTFVQEEAKMKEEIGRLKKELTAKDQRLHQVEENNKNLLTLRFDLSARNAELQEKLVKLHEKNMEFQKEINSLEEKISAKAKESTSQENLQKQLDETNKMMSKMKAQHKSKVKSLTKQLDGLKKMSDANEEVVKLQNKIAELEEDKVSETHWKSRVSELEERISQQSQDLDTHVHMIALLEAEKLDHMKDIQQGREKVIHLEEEIENLKAESLELKNLKLSLEIKTVDLEEQIDIISKEKKELEEELEAKSTLISIEERHANEEKQALTDVSSSTQSIEVLEQRHMEMSGSQFNDEHGVLNRLCLEDELENLRKVIEEQKSIIMDLHLKVESKEEELDSQREMIVNLEHLKSEDKEDKLMDIVKDLNEMSSDLEEWKKRCTEVETRLQDLGVEKDELEECLKEVKTENSMLKQQLEDQKELAMKLKEQNNAIRSRDEKINLLQSMIEMNGQTLEAREMTLKDVHEKLNTVEKQFENRLCELKSVLHDKEKEIIDMSTSLAKQDDTLKDRDEKIRELTDILNKERQEFEYLQQHVSDVENCSQQLEAQLTDMLKTAAEKDLLNSQIEQDCQRHKVQVEKLSSELSDKLEYINRIEMEMNSFRNLENQLKIAEDNVKTHDEELTKLKLELETSKSNVQENVEKLNEAEKKVVELTEKNKKYIANLKARTLTVKSQEQKLQQYEVLFKEKENMVFELTATNEKLMEQLADKRNVDSLEVQDHVKRIDMLNKEMREEQCRTELLGEELTKATEKIITLEKELKNSETKLQEMHLLEEEISQVKSELKNRDAEANCLKEDNFRLNEQERQLRINMEENTAKHAQLIKSLEEKISVLETDLVTRKVELDEVRNIIADKELRIDQLTDQVMDIAERGSQSLSANEAKLQEREAVVEFLEQEVTKSKETIQHLEERLAFVEERRLSIENKAEALNLRAQESDRMKEEAIETESMFEKQFEMILASEENLKKKVSLLVADNEELSQKVAELTTQNIEAKREMQNMECNVKDLVKEVERLTPYEFSFQQASEKVETLELELKRVNSEFEYRMNEKVHKLQQQYESLEADMKNVNMELEKVELEKRTLLERYEKLNDVRLNLEDEIERLNEAIISYKLANESLKENFNNDELKNKLEERINLLEAELKDKTLALEEKNNVSKEQSLKIQILESEHREGVLTVESLMSSKEEANEKLTQLQNDLNGKEVSFEAAILEKDKLLTEMQGKIDSLELKLSETPGTTAPEASSEHDDHISCLNKELDDLRSVILQKDNEIKGYQIRMMQLQFSGSGDNTEPMAEQLSKLEDMIKAKQAEISDMNSVLSLSTVELEQLRSQHVEDKDKIEMLDKELEMMREEIMNRDNCIQQLQIIETSSTEVESLRNKYESQLSDILQQKEQLYKELLEMKARQEVSDIVHVAEDRVQRMIETSEGKDKRPKKKSVTFQEDVCEQTLSIDQSEVVRELEDKLRDLEEELQLVKCERDEALLRVSQLATHALGSDETDVMLTIGSDAASKDLSSIPRQEPQVTVVTLGAQSWEVSEEEGWWGSDEARLEEEHIQKQQHAVSFSEPADILNKRITELEEHIKDLEVEKEKFCEEVHNAQVRNGKMLKKLKELKLKNENLLKENMELTKKKNENAFSDLDKAIEEELKIQIDSLERELKELTNERDSIRAEKDSLLKRIDVLVSANEKLIESKERQDIDLELWKQKNKDLSNQIESLEWRIGELEANNSVQDQKTGDKSFFSWDKQGFNSGSGDFLATDALQGQATSASGDNHQDLLEKERSLRLVAENHHQDLQRQLINVNAEIEQLAMENAMLKTQLEQLHQPPNVNYLQSAYNAVNEEYHRVATENIALKNQLEQFSQQHDNSDLESTYNKLNEQYNQLSSENVDLRNRLEQLNQQVSDMESAYNVLKEEYTHLTNKNVDLKNQLEEVNQQITDLQSSYNVLKVECTQLSNENVDLKNQQQVSNDLEIAYTSLNDRYNHIATENADLKSQLEHLFQQQSSTDLQSAYNALSEKYDNLYKETEEFKSTADQKYDTMKEDCNKKINDLTNENTKLDEMYRSLQRDQDNLLKELEEFNALKIQYLALQSEFNNLQATPLKLDDDEKLRLEQELHHLEYVPERDISNVAADMLSQQHIKIVQMEKEFQVRIQETEKLRQVNEDHEMELAKVEQEWNHKMERLRKELELTSESLLQQQNRYLILEKEHEEMKDHMNKVIENRIQEAVSKKQQEVDNLKMDLQEKESYFESQKELIIEEKMKQNEKDIQDMKHRLAESIDILNIRENDIRNLTTKLSEKDIELNEALSIKDSDIQNLKIQIVDNEKKLGELLGQKDQDIQNLRIQLSEKDLKISELEESLDEEIRQCNELRAILDSSKEKTNIPMYQLPSNVQHHDVSTSATEDVSVHSSEDEKDKPSDPQQELDLALYMLHQRDVRCDELTLELMQLLEERDTLQLRLSNALRMNEELRNLTRTSTESSPVKILSQSPEKDFPSSSREESPQHIATDDIQQTLVPTSVEVEEDLKSLADKLSELRRVGYHRDVTLHDERQQRHSEQVRLLHQRGQGIVVDASYTLSRDVQSPSTVIFNWIWGRSTPRVMHI